MDCRVRDLARDIGEGRIGAGTNVRDVLEAVPGGRSLAVAELFRGLAASRRYWSKADDNWIVEPDYRTRLDCARTILAYSDGLPAQTQVNIVVPSGGAAKDTIEELAARSPAMRKKLARALADGDGAVETEARQKG